VVTTRYEEALRQVQSLSPSDQKRLLAEVGQKLDASAKQRTSILRLKGLGKNIWSDLDAQGYVNQERASWDG
jgi:hypothetical protein